jgi:hypothetical protein
VRCQVALALGEWGGEEASTALSTLLESEVDEDVQLYCITALRLLGGPTAAEGLRQAVERGPEPVRDAALGAIAELVTGGSADDTEGPPLPLRPTVLSPETKGPVQERGTVRTRGGGQGPRGTYHIDRLRETLHRIRTDESASASVRHKAQDLLAYLQG